MATWLRSASGAEGRSLQGAKGPIAFPVNLWFRKFYSRVPQRSHFFSLKKKKEFCYICFWVGCMYTMPQYGSHFSPSTAWVLGDEIQVVRLGGKHFYRSHLASPWFLFLKTKTRPFVSRIWEKTDLQALPPLGAPTTRSVPSELSRM